MSNDDGAGKRIADEVTAWPGVSARLGRRGELGFRVNGREIGHLHGDHAAHFFPKDLWRERREQGRVLEHPVFPGRQGPAARRIEDDADAREVIEFLRLNYDHVAGRPPRRDSVAGGVAGAPA